MRDPQLQLWTNKIKKRLNESVEVRAQGVHMLQYLMPIFIE